ncbi:MAG: hypothetical protein Q9161_007297 [Pseudevernia consocians]
MAPTSPVQNLAFRAHATSSDPQAHTKASSSKQVVILPGPPDKGAASVDVTYKVVWTAGEPPPVYPQGPRHVWTAGGPPPHWSQGRTASWAAIGSPSIWPPRQSGNVRITGSAAEDGMKKMFQSEGLVAPTPEQIPKGKIPCLAILRQGNLGGLSSCLYDIATDSFNNFSADNGTWGHNRDYHDYGEVQMSTRKWMQGSWSSVEDDNGKDFLFLTVEKDHGIVRVWRPNLVAKRVVGVRETKLTQEEVMRLGLKENDEF